MTYETKDSGERAHFESGMQRDTQTGKPRFDLTQPKGIPFDEQLLTRFALLMGRGAEKYTERNWEQASGQEELDRFLASAFRHFMQWYHGHRDEDHAAAVIFNLMGYETTRYKMEQAEILATQEEVAAPFVSFPDHDEPQYVVPKGVPQDQATWLVSQALQGAFRRADHRVHTTDEWQRSGM